MWPWCKLNDNASYLVRRDDHCHPGDHLKYAWHAWLRALRCLHLLRDLGCSAHAFEGRTALLSRLWVSAVSLSTWLEGQCPRCHQPPWQCLSHLDCQMSQVCDDALSVNRELEQRHEAWKQIFDELMEVCSMVTLCGRATDTKVSKRTNFIWVKIRITKLSSRQSSDHLIWVAESSLLLI